MRKAFAFTMRSAPGLVVLVLGLVGLTGPLAGCWSVESGRKDHDYAQFLRERVIDTRERAETSESSKEALHWLRLHDQYANALNDYLVRRQQAAAMAAEWAIGSQGNYRTRKHEGAVTCYSRLIEGEVWTNCY